MACWNVPPRAKILHALAIISGKKIKWVANNIAEVNGHKIQLCENGIYANGFKKKYLNEMAVAALMLKKKLPFSKKISKYLESMDWHVPEKEFYLLEKNAKKILKSNDITPKEVDIFIDKVNKKILESKFERLEMSKSQVSMFSFQ